MVFSCDFFILLKRSVEILSFSKVFIFILFACHQTLFCGL
jgi:hypothetical protein